METWDSDRYHDLQSCGVTSRIWFDDQELGYYTTGVYEGDDGWALVVGHGNRPETVHYCPCSPETDQGSQRQLCTELWRGKVEVAHGCPRQKSKHDRELKERMTVELIQREVRRELDKYK
jgi:hypothetical protein